MRNAFLAALVAVSFVTGGWILVQDRADADESAFAAALRVTGGEPAPDSGSADDPDREPATFYRYTDDAGSMRFVASLADVPKHLRDKAQPVAEGRVSRAPAAAPRAERPQRAAQAEPVAARQQDVIVYTTSWCGWCRKTLAFLDQQGVDYENRDIEADDAWRQELEEKTGSTSIPVVEIGGQLVRGYDPARIRKLLEES